MEHVAGCSDCARFWEDLHGAQRLAMGLPQARVGSRFRDEVWQRIQAGEGAPDNIAQEPVPALAKVRYGLLGAAAAAVFILAVHYGFRPGVVEPSGDPSGEELAKVAEPLVTTPAPAVRDLTPANLAVHTANQVSMAARSLRHRSRTLTRVEQFQPEVIRDVREKIETMRSGLVMLKQLREGFGIEFRDNDARDCLTRVLTTLEFHPNLEQPEQVRQTLHAITGCSLDRLQENLRFSPKHNLPHDPRFALWANRMFIEQHRIMRNMIVIPSFGQPWELRIFAMIGGIPAPADPSAQTEEAKPRGPRKLRERSPR